MMIWKPSGTDPAVESRARDHARWLIRDHGDDAEQVLEAKMRRRGLHAADLYRYQLTARELQRLRKSDAAGESQGTAVTVWQPRLFSAERLLRLFGVRAVDRRRRPRS